MKKTSKNTELLCDKLRRLAKENEEQEEAQKKAKAIEDIQKIIGDSSFVPEKTEKGTYLICNQECTIAYYWSSGAPLLRIGSQGSLYASNPVEFGKALIHLDRLKTFIPPAPVCENLPVKNKSWWQKIFSWTKN